MDYGRLKMVTKCLQEILTAASTQSNNLKGVDKKDYISNLPRTNEKFRVFFRLKTPNKAI